MILHIVTDASTADDLVIEYSSHDGIRCIVDDTTLQEAYLQTSGEQLIIGIQLSDEYTSIEDRVRRKNGDVLT